MKIKYFLCLFLSVSSLKQTVFSSQEPNRTEIYGKVAAMLRGEIKLQIEAYKRYKNHPQFNIFQYIPPEHRTTKDCFGQLKILDSWTTEYFTPKEATELVHQASITHDQDKVRIHDFLTTGSWGNYSCLCGLGTGLTRETDDLRLSYRLTEFDSPIATVIQRDSKKGSSI